MENNVLVVVGMHRSGTSLLTQWLYKCGLNVGDQLVGPSTGNEDGHFEDTDFFELHRQTLREQELPDNGFIHHALDKLTNSQKIKLERLIDKKNSLQHQWGWKDPRTCLFLPFYRQLIPHAKYIVIWRSYNVVVSSLINRIYNLDVHEVEVKKGLFKSYRNKLRRKHFRESLCAEHTEDFLKIWIAYNEAILNHLKQLPAYSALIIEHSALVNNNQDIFKHLSTQWNFDLNYYNLQNIYKESLVSKVLDIDKYINDKSLLTHAKQVEEGLFKASNFHH